MLVRKLQALYSALVMHGGKGGWKVGKGRGVAMWWLVKEKVLDAETHCSVSLGGTERCEQL